MKIDMIARIPLFSVLEREELAGILENTTSTTVPSGEYLFRRGDQGDALYIVETGLLEAVIDEETSSERSLNTFFPSDFFGEMALLTEEPRSASIRALIDSTLIRLSHEQFRQLLDHKPEMALHLSKVLSSYLARTNAKLSRRGARISSLIPIGHAVTADLLAGQLLASLERQFGLPAIVVILGDFQYNDDSEECADISNILSCVRPLPSGGQYLRFSERMLQIMDDQALIGAISSLRNQYGHILVWARPSQAVKRLSTLTRFDQTFLLSCHPFDEDMLRLQVNELDKVMKGRLRLALMAPCGYKPPAISSLQYPPIRIKMVNTQTDKEGIDRFARALAGVTVGLALGSGTAQGLAHLGVMKALIEAEIPIDLIAGTSGGALYGCMIASGMPIDESVSRVIHHTRRNLIDKLDFAFPTRGIIRGKRIENMVASVIGNIDFSDLAIPLYAVAADLDSGEEVIIHDGLVHQGVRASISVPGIFEPYSLNGRTLIDGVVVNPLPVSVARRMGANIVIGVQVPAPGKVNMEIARAGKRPKKHRYNIISTVVRSHHYVGDRLADESASSTDVFIKPDVTRFGWREYSAAPDIIEEGYQAGKAAIKQISEQIWGP